MVAATVGDYTGAAPFHTCYMTVSGHLRYTFGGNFIARKNRDLVADLPLGEHARAYLATQIELDRALELLLQELEAAGVADRTLIAVSADHYPYGLSHGEIVASLDILPTLLNLMDLEYDSRLLMGVDAFSDAPPLVIFNNRSFISDRGRYNAKTRQFIPTPGAEVPEDYRARVSTDIDRRFYYSALVLDDDYYAIARPG